MTSPHTDDTTSHTTSHQSSSSHAPSHSSSSGKLSSKRSKNKKIDKYSFGSDIIGKGGYGVVYKGLNTETGEFVAIKQISIAKCSKEHLENIMQEIDLLRKLEHLNIIKYVDHKQTKRHLYIIMEYAPNGSLQDMIRKYSHISEKIVAGYIRQVLTGLKYLHEEGVIHRDIKGANLLLSADRTVKLADFGVAASLADVDGDHAVGTPYWMAPEIIDTQPATTSSDIWSVGCTVIELLTGKPPYFNLDTFPALYRIVKDPHPPLPKCTPECKTFLRLCFKKNPLIRASAEKLLKEEWIVKHTSPEELEKEKSGSTASLTTAANGKTQITSEKGDKQTAKPPLKPQLSKKQKELLKKFADEEEEDLDWEEDELSNIDEKLSKGKGSVVNGGVDSEQGSEEPRKSIRKEFFQNLAFERIIQQQRAKFGKPQPQGGGNRIEAEDPDENDDLDDLLSDQDDDWDNDDADDDFGDDETPNLKKSRLTEELDLGARLQKKFSLAQDSRNALEEEKDPFEDEDVFKEIDKEFEELASTAENEEEDTILELLETIKPETEQEVLLSTCEQLIEVFREKPELKSKITQHHGVLPIMQMLEVDNPAVVHATLQVINQLIEKNQEFQETLCLVGALPVIMEFSKMRYKTDIRVQASQFIREMCHTSAMTLEMFIACRGLPVLVEFMNFTEAEWEHQKRIIFDAIDNTMQVFQRRDDQRSKSIKLPTNDFCRLFARSRIMDRLTSVLLRLNEDGTNKDSEAENDIYIGKICTITLLFSQADSVVKQHMVQVSVLSKIIQAMPKLKHQYRLSLITCLKYLTLDTTTLPAFENADAIPVLVNMLGDETSIMWQSIACINALCFISVDRQRQMAQSGIIPHLKHIIEKDTRMRNLAHHILCNLAHAGKEARDCLWRNDVGDFYVSLLKKPSFQHSTLEAISVWLADDSRLENVLMKPKNLQILVDVVSGMNYRDLGVVTSSLKKLVSFSVKLNRALGRSKFVDVIVRAIKNRSHDALVYVEQMNILQLLYKYSEDPKRILIASYNVVKPIAEDEHNQPQMVLSIAKSLLQSYFENVKL
uniref:non-specific serine/threonine protein kinase n=1 Tax=Percolomonas cosmopolitus TaxID=63605 RepID=A0A7S1KN36_9EUKA|eukprot:CAMPEP_0117443412 /NCGR_PEP_ID=MMETSP0759-20121206/4681_1 /TAXON_ID=63605 /ORGANISM="Percolomonas cosmopolitus, Strain WS" /LENGTH=1061 /DNA_ID=CAMNT_0005235385 /DNA_START=31 /DNA_END=3216 /DNA_ORIENTATION=+